jgi:tetratricopeptide (TPR) repeat protein
MNPGARLMRHYFRLLAPLAVIPLLGATGADTGATAPTAPICHTEAKPAPISPAKALLTGYGTGGFAITTASPQAQAYFDNGMQLAHAFAHAAATAAFKRAEQLDPTCAMCVWGEAWSRGPTINYPIEDDVQKDLAGLADKAAALALHNPPRERALIAALQRRYHDGGGKGDGDDGFARAMDALARANPADNEIAVMAADAWMIPAAQRGDRDHLDRALAILEPVLARSPNDTGAIHFYIHATEMDGVGTKALPYALKLQALAPAASHLVHMPSHTYYWAGRFRMAEQSNLDAVEIDKANARRLNTKGGVFGLVYHSHNVMYGEGAALLDGDGAGALSLAGAMVSQIKPDDPYAQLLLAHAYMAYGRYGSDAEVAGLADPGAKLPFAQAMRHYALGEAAARRGDVARVKAEAAAITVAPAAMAALTDARSTAQGVLEVAPLVLAGRAAMLEKDYAGAQAAYRRAAEIEEARLGDFADPPAWWYPVRRSLAAALVADGKPAQAAVEARKVLLRWPYEPMTLRVLADAEAAQGDGAGAARELAYAQSNWTGDVKRVPAALE